MNTDSPLLIARLGGIPCDAVLSFRGRLEDNLQSMAALEAELGVARNELVDCLYKNIHDADPAKRHALLSVKRDCFNGRLLQPHCSSAEWEFVEEAAGRLAHRVLQLEQDSEVAWRQFLQGYETESGRQYQCLRQLLDDPLFATGLAVASPVVAREADRIRKKALTEYGRRERRLATTLLRYVSRAALKLSPFSTFTTVGLAAVDDQLEPLSLAGGGWRRRSLVRLRHHILERCADLLAGYKPWRNTLSVVLNDSVLSLDDGRLLLRRPHFYQPDEKERKLFYREESIVRVRLQGPLVDALRSLLADNSLCYGDLVASVMGKVESTDSSTVTSQIDRLIEIGFLHLKNPWSSNDPHLEATMLRELRQLAGPPALERLIAQLERLLQIEVTFFQQNDQLGLFLEMDELIASLLQSAGEIGGISPDIEVTTRISEHDIYQDVWCAPENTPQGAIVRVRQAPLEDAVLNVRPLVRYARLFDHRLEFLLTLGSVLREQQSGGLPVPILQAFEIVRPLWQEFVKFQVSTRKGDQWRDTWNPRGLPRLEQLAAFRDAVYRDLPSCLHVSEEGQRIDGQALTRLLDSHSEYLQDGFTGACLFLQPAALDGSLWILNRLKEGTGRFGSRYTPLMPKELQERYGQDLAHRGRFLLDGEQVELLDVHCVQGDTLNIHVPQTPKVLAFSGDSVHVAEGRCLALSDLYISIGKDGWPHVRDRSGQRYLPAYLGVAFHDYLPTLVKFICAFGPTEMGAVFPKPLERRGGGVVIQERTVIGNVVLQRKSWHVQTKELRSAIEQPTDPQAFVHLRRWQKKSGIPDQVFVMEKVPHPILGSRYQPQYLDFTSPLFLALVRSIVMCEDATLGFAELLPSPEMFPADEKGQTWAAEILVDSLVLPSPSLQNEIGDSEIAAVCSS